MAYLSLYRKWRPQTFDDVVGQRHVVRTLVNALNDRRAAHAYLFCGPRGTGKTTVARLLAKGLNCEHGPTGQVCNTCDNCQRIAQGSALDVLEIDGASNRGIDEVREIRERVHYAPTHGVYKVYIVDEVHMLTNEAFNALLKMLEEPPAHVVFVFATTEAHKIPPTILSRCQRFDFHRFRPNELVDQLRKVLGGENVPFEEGALGLVARHAEGGMRDALAVLDQCIAYQPEGITVEVVNEVLGTAPRARLVQFVRTHLEGSIGDLLVLIRELDEASTDLRQFTRDVIGYLRDLMIIRASGAEADRLITLLDGEKQEAAELAKRFSIDQIVQAVEVMGEVENSMRWAPSPTLALEIACVRLMEAIRAKPASQAISSESAAGTPQSAPEHGQPAPAAEHAVVKPLERVGAASHSNAPADRSGGQATPANSGLKTDAAEKAQPKPQPASEQRLGDSSLQEIWENLFRALREERARQIEALLREATPIQFVDGELLVSFPTSRAFHHASMEKAEHRQTAERLLSRITGRAARLNLHLGDAHPSPSRPQEVAAPNQEATDENAAGLDTVEDPTVRAALKLFGGVVTEVRREEDDTQ